MTAMLTAPTAPPETPAPKLWVRDPALANAPAPSPSPSPSPAPAVPAAVPATEPVELPIPLSATSSVQPEPPAAAAPAATTPTPEVKPPAYMDAFAQKLQQMQATLDRNGEAVTKLTEQISKQPGGATAEQQAALDAAASSTGKVQAQLTQIAPPPPVSDQTVDQQQAAYQVELHKALTNVANQVAAQGEQLRGYTDRVKQEEAIRASQQQRESEVRTWGDNFVSNEKFEPWPFMAKAKAEVRQMHPDITPSDPGTAKAHHLLVTKAFNRLVTAERALRASGAAASLPNQPPNSPSGMNQVPPRASVTAGSQPNNEPGPIYGSPDSPRLWRRE